MSLSGIDDFFLPLVTAIFAAALGRGLVPLVRTWVIFPLLLLLAVPSIWLGYAYGVQWTWSQSSLWHQRGTWFVLMSLRYAPLAALLLAWLPQAVSPSAAYLARAATLNPRQRVRLLWQGAPGRFAVCCGWVLLLVHHEFELASILNVERWTIRLFDGHANGIAPGESLMLVSRALPLFLLPALLITAGAGLPSTLRPASTLKVHAGSLAACVLCLVFLLILPLALLLSGVQDQRWLQELQSSSRDLTATLTLSAAAAGVFALLLQFCLRRPVRLLIGIPAFLLGPLVFGLLVLFAIPVAWTRSAGPLVLALPCLFLTPLGIAALLFRRRISESALHVLPAGRLHYRLLERPLVWTVALAFLWMCTELTLSNLLAPLGSTPVSVRLYNLMHYGQATSLSAMLVLSVVVPMLCAGAAVGAWGFLRRKHVL